MRGTGTPVHAERIGRGLFSALLHRMANKLPPTERKQKDVKPNGNKLRAQDVLTDPTLALWRGEYENGGISMTQMAAKYGVPYGRMYRLLTYQDRADVDAVVPQPAKA